MGGGRLTPISLPAASLAAFIAVQAPGVPSEPPAAAASTLRRVEVVVENAAIGAERLRAAGFDVLEHDSGTVELVVTTSELRALRDGGYVARVLETGRPMREVLADRRGADGSGPLGYPDLEAVYAALAQAEIDHPKICRVVDLTARYGTPTTYEDRSLFALRISDNVDVDEDEPAVLVVSAHHCRELVTPVVALNAISELTDGYGVDPDITAAIDENEIWIAPVWNPDGYEYVFTVDNLWRKNRRVFLEAVGVDLNRNYPFGWSSSTCAGSENPASTTYKGPVPASEAETLTMITWSFDRHFAKILDYHSAGRETLWGYACIDEHPLGNFLQAEAIALSTASGYQGEERGPSADGEHYQWQLGARGAHAFLIETHVQFQPPFESAEKEATQVFPGILAMLERPIPLSGRVTDAVTGSSVAAEVRLTDVIFTNGETNRSGGPFGRYHVFAPTGLYAVEFTAGGYLGQTHPVIVFEDVATVRDIRLTPLEFVGDVNRDGVVGFADVLDLLANWGPCPDPPDPCPGDFDGDGEIGFGDVILTIANWD